MQKVLVIATNLFFLPRIQNIAAPSGCNTRQVMTIDRLKEEMADGETVLVLVDLEADPDFWGEAVGRVLASGPSRPQGRRLRRAHQHDHAQQGRRSRLRPRADQGPIQPRPRRTHSRRRRVSRPKRPLLEEVATSSPLAIRNTFYFLPPTFSSASISCSVPLPML